MPQSLIDLAPLVLLALASVVAAGWVQRKLDRRRRQARARHASRGEQRAERLLRSKGYRIVERQALQPWTLHVNDAEHTVKLRADFLVTRRGHRYIAEVKTGSHVANLTHGPTRRQLLEYSHAFDVNGVVLVRVDDGEIDRVVFDPPRGSQHRRNLRPWLAIIGAAVTWIAVTEWMAR